jgi:hypothetical protein
LVDAVKWPLVTRMLGLPQIAGIGAMSVLLEQQRRDAQAMVERLTVGRP